MQALQEYRISTVIVRYNIGFSLCAIVADAPGIELQYFFKLCSWGSGRNSVPVNENEYVLILWTGVHILF